jgi:hypothetical protein
LITPHFAESSDQGCIKLVADLLGLSTGGSLPSAELAGLPAVPASSATLFHNPVLGTLSATTTQLLNCQASANFNAGCLTGAAQVDVTLDNQTVTAAIRLFNPGSLAQSITVAGGSVTIGFAGFPGDSYEIQRATDLGGPWDKVDTQVAPADGLFTYKDPNPPVPLAYYRLQQQ